VGGPEVHKNFSGVGGPTVRKPVDNL